MNVLNEIFAHKQTEVEARLAEVPMAELEAQVSGLEPTRGFKRALANDPRPIALIAEVKKASPSEGVIRADFDPAGIARAYEEAGATCLSVLTDERYFQGSAKNLAICRENCDLPLLRKDFIYNPYQVVEARVLGADALLLIAAMLNDDQLKSLSETAAELNLDVLVEVHNQEELDRVLNINGLDLIGVNNRDLSDFTVDLGTSERLIPQYREGRVAVAESAIHTHADVQRLQACGARAVLIGTSFMRSSDVGGKVREVMGWDR
ncbi:MAG: indole-3-glycerol phosphate synthase TrpC [Armatimonadetes bacterium]|nr:indole-3-glycerol phosphate synthase TrpC [Armatimonadota bacterium]